MSKLLKPERLNLDAQSPNAVKDWKYWFKTFENFIIMCGTDAPDKHLSLINQMFMSNWKTVQIMTQLRTPKKNFMSNHPTKCLLDIYLPLGANSAVKH